MRLAQTLRNMNNYNTLMAIIAGLSAAPVRRLHDTLKIVKIKSSKVVQYPRSIYPILNLS
jgi:hypothetical protein